MSTEAESKTEAFTSDPAPPQNGGADGASTTSIHEGVVAVLRTIYDPEIPVDIYEMGLVYEVDVRDDHSVYLKMTLTSPMCPVAEILPPEVEAKVRAVPGVEGVELDLVWDPPWNPDMMSEAAKLDLGMV
jgi:FeS assembly SUF system protein